jgi:alpha-glucosidase
VTVAIVLATVSICVVPVLAQAVSPNLQIAEIRNGAHIVTGAGTIEAEMMASNILRIDVQPGSLKTPRTLVLDPALAPGVLSDVHVLNKDDSTVIQSPRVSVVITHRSPVRITVRDATGNLLVEQTDAFGEARSQHGAILHHVFGENLYGMRGLNRADNGGGLLRNNGAEVSAGAQGEGGAPWFFTTRYGILIDSDGGSFLTSDGAVDFSSGSRYDTEYFVVVGRPLEVVAGLSLLTGRPPLPPKWSLGFLNSQWGADEAEIKQLVAIYRAKHIPLDGFILDYDWKAWGEDDYGEWRWNSTSSLENSMPNKFPDGASGEFAKELRADGVKLCGILKPRIFLYKKDSTTEMHAAAAFADAWSLWYPDEPPLIYAPPMRDLDFSNPETRRWYWEHLEPAFDAGMIGWWNDEADHSTGSDGRSFNFGNFQGFDMGRMLYEGQRGYSDLRVWSINRNYYLGAQRYGYAEWSGDIETGFESMQDQRMRMLATLDLGEPHWSMDTGGFIGHPSPENYARWVQFAAFVPIFRVHGDDQEKRQPWLYGPIAEAAATKAIRLRYELLPYIYSYERITTETGVGLVRPLFWMFPDDKRVANEGSSWMFGDAFLVSPVVSRGATLQRIYLPLGTWYDYARGTRLHGGQTINYRIDPKMWQDIPLFVHAGSIIASQPPQDYVDQSPISKITLDVFPDSRQTTFVYYDDDGTTYSYEHGAFYRQSISAFLDKASIHLTFEQPSGTFQSAVRSYVVRVHGFASKAVLVNGVHLPKVNAALTINDRWTSERDRFGTVTIVRMKANQRSSVVLQ